MLSIFDQGDNLPLVANFLLEHHPDAFARILEAMKARVPGVSLVEPRQTEGRGWCSVSGQQPQRPLGSAMCPTGTIKMFAYLVLLNGPLAYHCWQ